MDVYLLLLRIIHIFGGMFWVGAVVINFAFLIPTLRSSGPESQTFMQNLFGRQRFASAMGTAALLTILAGALLYWRDSGGLQLGWITTGAGMGFTIGAIAALASFVLGGMVLGPEARRLGELSSAIQTAGGPPTDEQKADMTRLTNRMNVGGRINLVLLTIALLCMATARYWVF